MKRRRLDWARIAVALTVTTTATVSAGPAQAASVCDHETLNKKTPIPFRPFEMRNPETGEEYLPNEEIQVGDKKMRAGDYFNELNETEQKLNEWGHTLRGSGAETLGELATCVEGLDEQVGIIEKSVKKGRSLFDLEQYRKDADEAYERFKAQIPSWDTLYAKADDESVKVYLPPAPSFSAPVPEMQRAEMKPVFKERTWNFDVGEKSKFWVGAEASLSMNANKVEASLRAKGNVKGSLLGFEKTLGTAEAIGETFGSDEGKLGVEVKVLGITLYDKEWKAAGYKKEGQKEVPNEDQEEAPKEDQKELPMEYGFEWRFAVGPIPMKARIGARGGIGVKWGVQIVPLQVHGYVVPYGYALAYAQVGVDIGIAAAGIGGELTLIADYVTLDGSAKVAFVDEPRLELSLSADNDLRALSGEFYAFAKVDLGFWDKKWRYTFFKWDGLTSKSNVFRLKWTWTPGGTKAEGDMRADDVAEIEAANAEARLIALENTSNRRVYDVVTAVSTDVNGAKPSALLTQKARLVSLDRGVDTAIKSYWSQFGSWVKS